MKNLLCALVILTTLCSCLGTRVRNELTDSTAELWQRVRPSVERGIEAEDLAQRASLETMLQEVDSAFESRRRRDLLVAPWAVLQPYAFQGIQIREDAGELGPGPAESLRERVRNFNEAYQVLTQRIVVGLPPEREYWAPNGAGRVSREAFVAAEVR